VASGYHTECGQWHEVNLCPAIISRIRTERNASKNTASVKPAVHTISNKEAAVNRGSGLGSLTKPLATIPSPSPLSLHQAMTKGYSKLPALPSFEEHIAVGGQALFVGGAAYLFIWVMSGEAPHWIIAAAIIAGTTMMYFNYSRMKNQRDIEINNRSRTKDKFDKLQSWYDKIEPTLRRDDKLSGYPQDWKGLRRDYIKIRDNGVCYLCEGSRNNDTYYFHRPRDGRHSYKNSKDFALHSQIHHIKPISKGGDHNIDTLVYLCNLCHEDQHLHLLKRRFSTLERKSKQTRNPEAKQFWINRLSDTRKRITSLESHYRDNPSAWRLHEYTPS